LSVSSPLVLKTSFEARCYLLDSEQDKGLKTWQLRLFSYKVVW
jgi:hypothetical protein